MHQVPPYRLKMFLSNVNEPMRLLEVILTLTLTLPLTLTLIPTLTLLG